MAMKALEPAPAIRMSCEVGARALKPPSNEEMAAASGVADTSSTISY
jgi:hypothetical protein